MKIDRAAFIELIKQNVSNGEVGELTLATRREEVGIDSLGFATLLFSIEEKLNTQIDEKNLEGLNGRSTVEQFVTTFRTLGYEIEV